ncbi:SRPBCC family protein [Streptomyces qinglanensis]|uniref:Polyketide cyclase / dehydrase and lipid transport n=1 Tax=Streptomyces qinglanensis TaxID=943816 RepID=A0A1H9U669_9ACTN|nr:SRPBCC family protein [Streptomyces qinglanensis]SES04812.1 Polyketide cyclase / dehydrase and lipid transport [Streptomyces qinglanensis]
MSAIEETVEVRVPVHTAYNQWTQFADFPRFMSSVREVEQVKPNLTRWVVGAGPLRGRFQAEIVEQRPDAYLAWRSTGRRHAHSGEVCFRPAETDRSTVTVRMRMHSPGAAHRLAAASGLLRGTVRRELGRFKEFIEAVGEESGAWRGSIGDGRVQPEEPEPPRSRVPHWPVG